MSALLGAGLVMVLFVNTWLAQGSFTVHQLTLEQSRNADQTQALARSIAAQAAPQALAARAVALGMVPAPNPVFKRTADGAVLGVATRAWAPPPPRPQPAQPAQLSASVSPGPSSAPSVSASVSPSSAPSVSASVSPSSAPSVSASVSASVGKP